MERAPDKETGEVSPVEVFIAIFGASQLTYVEAVMSQQKEDFISTCENTLHYMGGVTYGTANTNSNYSNIIVLRGQSNLRLYKL